MKTRVAALLALLPQTALAHPGHGHTDPESWLHYLTEPVHVAVLAAAATVVVIAAAARRYTRRRSGPE